jgi:hypothetical protein
MRHVLAAVLCIAIPIAMLASEKNNGYKVPLVAKKLGNVPSVPGFLPKMLRINPEEGTAAFLTFETAPTARDAVEVADRIHEQISWK